MGNDAYKKCPYCCEQISNSATKCQYCGQFLIEEKITPKDAVCPICDEPISTSDFKCKHCNSIITPELVSYSMGEVQQNNSGMTDSTITHDSIKGWSWGAFVFVWLWGIPNKSFLSALTLVPYAGIVWRFVCGAKGREWAWKNKKWKSVQEFNQVQKAWDSAGIFTLTILVIAVISICWYESKHPGTILKIYTSIASFNL